MIHARVCDNLIVPAFMHAWAHAMYALLMMYWVCIAKTIDICWSAKLHGTLDFENGK